MTAEMFIFEVPLGEIVRHVLLLAVKGTLLLGTVLLILRFLRGASSHARHQILLATMGALVILPLFTFGLPAWKLPILPAPESFAETSSPDLQTEAAPPLSEQMDRSRESSETAGSMEGEQTTASSGIPLSAFIIPVWLAGAAVVFIVHAFRIAGIHLMVAWSRPTADDRLNELFIDSVDEIGIHGRIRLLVSDLAAVPMTCGFFRHSIILPAEAGEWSDERVKAILLHELTHARRRDNLAQVVVSLACALNWFNPLVWIAAHRLVFEREKACDDSVIRVGTAPSSYAKVLLSIAESLQGEKCRLMPAAMAKESDVKGRLKAILSTGVDRGEFGLVRTSALFIVAMLIVLPVATLNPWGASAMPSVTESIPDMASEADAEESAEAEEVRNIDGGAYDFYYHKKDYAKAGAIFDDVRKRFPYTAHIHVMAGHCKYKLGDYAGALEAYRTSLQLMIRFNDIYQYIAQASFRLGREDLGYHYLYRGMQYNPDYDFSKSATLSNAMAQPRGEALLQAVANGDLENLESDYILPDDQLGSVPRLVPPPVTDELITLGHIVKTSRSTKQREDAVEWIGAHGSDKALMILTFVLNNDPDEDVLEEAVQAMAETLLPNYIERLIEVARQSPKAVVRIEAAKHLARVRPDESEELLRSVLDDPNGGDAYRDALNTFIRFGLDRAVMALEDIASNHESLRVRAMARSMLTRAKR